MSIKPLLGVLSDLNDASNMPSLAPGKCAWLMEGFFLKVSLNRTTETHTSIQKTVDFDAGVGRFVVR